MSTPLETLIACGTKLWLDSVDPELVRESLRWGATGATSNPIIISDLIRSGRFDDMLSSLVDTELSDGEIAWQLTDHLVRSAQHQFLPAWRATGGDDGYVSFELDPLLEDTACTLSVAERSARYVELGTQWSAGHENRMIKVPATAGGLGALEDLVAAGVTVNVTLLFTMRQYEAARDAIWRGAQQRASLDQFKSVYSIFVSRIDVYTEQHVAELSQLAQGLVGIVNAQRIWWANREFWRDQPTPLRQEMVFASTGTKRAEDPVDKYVRALAGSDIQTNPPATNAAVQELPNCQYLPAIDQLPPEQVLKEIDTKVDFSHMERTLMDEGLRKFADPQKELLSLIAERRED